MNESNMNGEFTEGIVSKAKCGANSLCDKLFKMCDCVVKSDYDVTLRLLPDENSGEATCTHHFKGSMKHDVVKLLTAGAIAAGAVIGVIAIIHMTCFCIFREK